MNIRESMEQREQKMLSPYAALSLCSRGRERQEEECDVRTVYQRDRDRILHSKAFRRIVSSRQVIEYQRYDIKSTLFYKFFYIFFKKVLTLAFTFDIVSLVSRESKRIPKKCDMRKCRNWQTSKTKDLVSIALVWVQVPSSALFI